MYFGGHSSQKPWRGLKRRIGKNELLPFRDSTVYVPKKPKPPKPQVRTPVGKRRDRRGQGKPR